VYVLFGEVVVGGQIRRIVDQPEELYKAIGDVNGSHVARADEKPPSLVLPCYTATFRTVIIGHPTLPT
jgi:hypothetical protein